MIPSGATIGTYHTYDDLHLIPKKKLILAPPQPKITTFRIMGMDGAIDATEALCGAIPHTNRTGTWDFLVMSGLDYASAYELCLTACNGEMVNLVLDDAPSRTMRGRFSVNAWKSYEKFSTLSIDYDVSVW